MGQLAAGGVGGKEGGGEGGHWPLFLSPHQCGGQEYSWHPEVISIGGTSTSVIPIGGWPAWLPYESVHLPIWAPDFCGGRFTVVSLRYGGKRRSHGRIPTIGLGAGIRPSPVPVRAEYITTWIWAMWSFKKQHMEGCFYFGKPATLSL